MISFLILLGDKMAVNVDQLHPGLSFVRVGQRIVFQDEPLHILRVVEDRYSQ